MKKVYLIGFRGTGFRDEKYAHEPALICAGHVGFAFEGDEMRIFGFHPSPEAAQAIGDDEAVITWLKAKKTIEGILQEDYDVFKRASELGERGAQTNVWQFAVELPDEEFEHIREQAIA